MMILEMGCSDLIVVSRVLLFNFPAGSARMCFSCLVQTASVLITTSILPERFEQYVLVSYPCHPDYRYVAVLLMIDYVVVKNHVSLFAVV
jgi:hypothetical protein